MITITAAVGRGGMNRPDDVRTVQILLNKHRSPSLRPIAVNSALDPGMIAAIEEFQRRVVKLVHPDGRVDPSGRTLAALVAAPSRPSPAAVAQRSGAAWWHAKMFFGALMVPACVAAMPAKWRSWRGVPQNCATSRIWSTPISAKARAFPSVYPRNAATVLWLCCAS